MFCYDKNKYRELEIAIKNHEFPIIVYGPSNTGKTYAIQTILNNLKLKYKEVDLNHNYIKKPINNELIILTCLNDIDDLNKILYKKRVIIETNIHFCNKIKGYKTIKFNKKKDDLRSCNRTIISEKVLYIDLYHFLGKIFYKKLHLSNVNINYDRIFLSENSRKVVQHKTVNCEKLDEIAKSDKSDLAFEIYNNEIDINKLDKSLFVKNKKRQIIESDDEIDINKLDKSLFVKNKKRQIIESDDEIDINKLDKSLFVKNKKRQIIESDDESVLIEEMLENNKSIVKEYLNTENNISTKDNYISFSTNKIISYIYENGLYFLNTVDLEEFNNLLSLYLINKSHIFTIIQYLNEKAKNPKKMFSFKSVQPEIRKYLN